MLSVVAGQYLPASSEDDKERCGQDEEPVQLPGKDHTLQIPQAEKTPVHLNLI